MLNVSISREAAKELLEATNAVSWENADFQEGVAALTQAVAIGAEHPVTQSATVHQIALVQVTNMGSDVGLYVNGDYVMSADPAAGDDDTALKATALALCAQLEIPITHLEVHPTDEWQWNEITDDLHSEGRLVKSASQPSH